DPKAELLCLGLGSCIAICAYDPVVSVGAIVHVVLPAAPRGEAIPPGKYACTAVPLLCHELRSVGARLERVKIALCGGAAIFPPLSGLMDIGQRNLTAVREKLKEARLTVVKEDVGGRESRTVMMSVSNGIVRVRTVRLGECPLVDLRR
ncbi:MAG TPA: chemotaxis protein CheD, partial [Armatimonadota bacterium]